MIVSFALFEYAAQHLGLRFSRLLATTAPCRSPALTSVVRALVAGASGGSGRFLKCHRLFRDPTQMG
jgi:hypothetical protein